MPDAEVTDLSAADFKVTFECTNAIRTIAEVLHNMLETVDVHVWATDAFRGIKIQTMDSMQTSLVIASLRADVTMDCCEHTAFCVNTKVFHTCVKSAQPHYSIHLASTPRSSSLVMTAFDALSNASLTRFTLPTLVCNEDPVEFNDIEYQFQIDMETNCLRSILKMSTSLNAERLTFRVQQPTAAAAKRQRMEGKHTVLTISSDGACSTEHSFYSLTKDGGTTTTVCDELSAGSGGGGGMAAEEEMETKYEEIFATRRLAEFIKSIDRQTITLCLSANSPIVINHRFGNDDASSVCLVAAPITPEE